MHWYASVGDRHAESIKLLISLGAPVNALNVSGDTPLHVAAEEIQLETIVLLLKNGADPTKLDRYERNILQIMKGKAAFDKDYASYLEKSVPGLDLSRLIR